MIRPSVLTTASLCALLSASLVTPGSASAQKGRKQEDPSAPSISGRLRERFSVADKTTQTAKATSARVSSRQDLGASIRASQFAGRAKAAAGAEANAEHKAGASAGLPARLEQRRPHLPDQYKTSGVAPFVGRHGTGLGDIYEVGSGEDPDEAQIVDDLPANVVGDIGGFDDVDFYAFTATAGEYIRLEIIADRIFDSDLDSFLYLVDEEERVLETNDDGYSNSFDSFIAFRAPYSGIYYVGVTDSVGRGDNDFDYVLSISSSFEDVDEEESNDRLNRADVVPLPGTVFADSDDDEDQDVFRFSGVAGQALIVDVDAELFLSEADMVVELLDNQGRFIFGNDDFDGHDPRFNIVLPYTGTYFLLAYDLNRKEGSSDHYYTLNLSAQSSALAPRTTGYRTKGGNLRVVIGSNFDPSAGGSTVEIDAKQQPSFNQPANPTTKIKLSQPGILSGSDSITVVNPDGRRSNPIILR